MTTTPTTQALTGTSDPTASPAPTGSAGFAAPTGSPGLTGSSGPSGGRVAVCAYGALLPERGAAALVGGRQLALFRTYDGKVFALGNHDPFSGANVISRGIVGNRGDIPTVASPMFKQVFDLRTGQCLDDPEVRLPSYPVDVVDGQIVVDLDAGA